MKNNYLVTGLVAGGVSAILYLTVVTGSLFGLLLFYLAPLPIFIAGFGWGVLTAAIAGGSGFIVTTIASGLEPGGLFLATVSVPVVAITYLAQLSRPVPDTDPPESEWYPLGRLVIWIGVVSCALVVLAIILLGPDTESFRNIIRSGLQQILEANEPLRDRLGSGNSDQTAEIIELLVWAMPPASAILWMLTTLANLWLASRIVEQSGMARRPRDQFQNIVLPGMTGVALLVALVVSTLPGLIGIIGVCLTGVLALSFTIQGLAVVHVMTNGHNFRGALLFITYLTLLMTSWIGLALMTGLGLVESIFGLRARFGNRGGPPTQV